MSRLSSAVDHHNGQAGLPAVIEELLAGVAADGFAIYCCGPKEAPNALVACYEWDHYADLLAIGDFDRITTARVPRRDSLDIFAPHAVVWAYEGPPQHAVRALLDLVHPAHPDAPSAAYPAPAGLHIPRTQQRPMTIRLPAPSRTRARAERLAAALTTHGRSASSGQAAHQIPGWPPVERAAPDARLPAASWSTSR